uniref:LRRNT domain-containing protein n=1 Tax=Pavo cristatus TaxID=9049 RepID=A0A8C9G9S4_PAVCR
MLAWGFALVFLLGMGMASGDVSCPSGCSCRYLEVNCTGQQLQEFPAAIPLDTRQLILAANNVSYLPAMELSFLADLVYLDCRKNLLGDDLDFTFIGVVKLVYLDLSFNNLTQVTFSTFSHGGAGGRGGGISSGSTPWRPLAVRGGAG